MSLLGLAASAQIGVAVWHLFHPPATEAPATAAATALAVPGPAPAAPAATAEPAPTAAATPEAKTAAATPAEAASPAASPTASPEEEATAEAEKQLLASQAEKQLLASIPRPTPLPVRAESLIEMRVNGLLHLARALRDRGDTSTALTRLREAQAISPENPQVISEMAMTYEKMGLGEKAAEQWRRIYEIGEKAGIYYAAAEAKLRAPEPADASATPEAQAPQENENPLLPEGTLHPPNLTLGSTGTTDDTGNSQAQRRLKLRIPIAARPGTKIDVHEVVIQVYFYDQLKDGSIVETNANVSSSWARRTATDGSEAAVDWSTPEPEVLEVSYAQEEPEPPLKSSRNRKGKSRSAAPAPERRNYFGYVVRVYYKGDLNASHADPEKLLTQFPPPVTLQTSDLPQ